MGSDTHKTEKLLSQERLVVITSYVIYLHLCSFLMCRDGIMQRLRLWVEFLIGSTKQSASRISNLPKCDPHIQ